MPRGPKRAPERYWVPMSVGHAEHRDVGVDRLPIRAGRGLAEGRVAHEGQFNRPVS